MRWIFPDRLMQVMPDISTRPMNCAEYCREFLRNLDIRYSVAEQDLARVPTKGSALVVANHPFGFLEGMILLALLEKVRVDYRVVGATFLERFPALRERVFFVNNLSNGAEHENRRSLRSSIEWLRDGGLLVMFPAGEVAHMNWSERRVADPKWNAAAARLARKTSCVTLPLFFEGGNSPGFQMMGTIHPRLRTLHLPVELMKKSSQTIRIRIGTAIPGNTLQSYADPEAATEYLRARTYLLSHRAGATNESLPANTPWFVKTKPVASSSSGTLMEREIALLPADRLLAKSEDFAVYAAAAAEIPQTLHEIGRCREVTYRQVGEGTGRPLDLDQFDDYYQHIVLWHTKDRRVAGAYRLAATPDVLRERGIAGLYTNTLFQYEPEFYERIGSAFELGRSFICREYQKQYAPLLLLWRGIIKFVERRPECAILFGAVSVSSEYQALSRNLIVNFLNGHITNSASHWIRPRRQFRGQALVPRQVKQLGRLLPTVDELSSSIQDLEADGKGLPVLIKQYLKVGGQLLGFNVDRHFANALDVLVMADLRTASGPMLDRCMGREQAAAFRAFHAERKPEIKSRNLNT